MLEKTTYSVTKRFQEHCRDYKKERCEKRPLYDAMNKYGIENFVVEELIECPNDELNSYEIMYIDKLGGTMTDCAAKIHCSVDTVKKYLLLIIFQ